MAANLVVVQAKEKIAITDTKVELPAPDNMLELIEASLDDDKAQDVVVIDLAGKTDFADYMVIATGTSQRLVNTMAQHLREKLKAEGIKGISIEGTPACDWVLLDGGDVVVHLFRPEFREFYDLEKLWGEPMRRPRPKPAPQPEQVA
ncbi:MAG: ribosome silencing factor [Rhodospirillales bacterium]|nr:ribosome silencing factor [Rhodospirillales bacterium]